jgi:hypothetical protein
MLRDRAVERSLPRDHAWILAETSSSNTVVLRARKASFPEIVN